VYVFLLNTVYYLLPGPRDAESRRSFVEISKNS